MSRTGAPWPRPSLSLPPCQNQSPEKSRKKQSSLRFRGPRLKLKEHREATAQQAGKGQEAQPNRTRRGTGTGRGLTEGNPSVSLSADHRAMVQRPPLAWNAWRGGGELGRDVLKFCTALKERSKRGILSPVRLPCCVTSAACSPSLDQGGLHGGATQPPRTGCTYFKPSTSSPIRGNGEGGELCVPLLYLHIYKEICSPPIKSMHPQVM